MENSTWQETAACISHIFAREPGDDSEDKYHPVQIGYSDQLVNIETKNGEVYPGYYQFKRPGTPQKQKGGGIRGIIKGFSKQSRLRKIKMMARLEKCPQAWQTLTFPDDVITGKSIRERAKYSYDVMHRFSDEIQKKFGITGIWRREYEPRKSGDLKGQLCPHFHIMFEMKGITEKNYKKICLQLAEIWVKHSKTNDPKALQVAVHPKSYAWLKSRKTASIYVSKYMAKFEQHEINESIGRCWGKIGQPVLADPVELNLSENEQILLKRLFKRYVSKSRNKNLKKMIHMGLGFILIQADTVERMLSWVVETTRIKALTVSHDRNIPF